MNWLVDDQHLGAFLRTGRRPRGMRVGDRVFTTGLWYVRLCQAALFAAELRGVLSGPFAELDDGERRAALEALVELPDDVGLLSLRDTGPVVARFRSNYRLNALAAEAVAAAVSLRARVLLAAGSPRLEAALAAEARPCAVRAPAVSR